MKRITEEEFGLFYSFVVLIALLMNINLVAIVFSVVLILLFLFRLSLRKKS